MKIRIEVDENIAENEIIIKCKQLDNTINKIQETIMQTSQKSSLVFYKGNIEYYLPLNSILFFETSDVGIDAHTAEDTYKIKNKLYELEEILPKNFTRVSKSTILNIIHIYSIDRNLTSSSLVKFNKTHKQVYVSRNYYKQLRQRLEERRNYEK